MITPSSAPDGSRRSGCAGSLDIDELLGWRRSISRMPGAATSVTCRDIRMTDSIPRHERHTVDRAAPAVRRAGATAPGTREAVAAPTGDAAGPGVCGLRRAVPGAPGLPVGAAVGHIPERDPTGIYRRGHAD